MVSRKGVVYRVWEDIEAVVKEEDKKEYDEREQAELDGSADLSRHQYGYIMSHHLTYNPACHLWPSLKVEELGG